jgi:hypothetical protein
LKYEVRNAKLEFFDKSFLKVISRWLNRKGANILRKGRKGSTKLEVFNKSFLED